jgi:hypothetical protein
VRLVLLIHSFFSGYMFLLVYINSTRGFYCGNSMDAHSVIGGTHYAVSICISISMYVHTYVYICIYLMYFNPFHPQYPFIFPSPFLLILLQCPPLTLMSHYYHCKHHHHFSYGVHIWAKTCDTCLSESIISLNMMFSSSIHFPTD